jgi:hypothetical protein
LQPASTLGPRIAEQEATAIERPINEHRQNLNKGYQKIGRTSRIEKLQIDNKNSRQECNLDPQYAGSNSIEGIA